MSATVFGCVEELYPEHARGWAYAKDDYRHQVEVEFFLDGQSIGRALGEDFREDLVVAGHGAGCYGFHVEFMPAIDKTAISRVEARVGQTVLRRVGQALSEPAAPFSPSHRQDVLPAQASTIHEPIAPPSDLGAPNVSGFVESLTIYQIRGWAWNENAPDRTLTVCARYNGLLVAEAVASLFREDLAAGGIGNGAHSFIMNFPSPLDSEILTGIKVYAGQDGSDETLLCTLPQQPAAELPIPNILERLFHIDETQEPVLVLGAARSGTSAMAQALLRHGGYEGHEEGHILGLLSEFDDSIKKYFIAHGGEFEHGRDTAARRVTRGYLHGETDRLVADMTRRLFPTGRWLDKTPNDTMIMLAPRILTMFPRARFIFMRRRFFENSESRRRKFSEFGFEDHCRQWSAAMSAWKTVRTSLCNAAIEVDQYAMSLSPRTHGFAVAEFLGLDGQSRERFLTALEHDHPERTSTLRSKPLSKATMGWDASQTVIYEKYCAALIHSFGYSEDEDYFADKISPHGFLIV